MEEAPGVGNMLVLGKERLGLPRPGVVACLRVGRWRVAHKECRACGKELCGGGGLLPWGCRC